MMMSAKVPGSTLRDRTEIGVRGSGAIVTVVVERRDRYSRDRLTVVGLSREANTVHHTS